MEEGVELRKRWSDVQSPMLLRILHVSINIHRNANMVRIEHCIRRL